MKKLIIILLMVLILIVGCNTTLKPMPENYPFENKGNDVDNNQYCFRLCKERENNPPPGTRYYCDYEVICDDDKCLCKTW